MAQSLPPFNVLAKPAGPACNLDCTYCFYLEKDQIYPEVNHFRMEGPVLESFISQKIEAHQVGKVHFSWQGGEPTLLGLDYFREVVRLQKRYANGKHIENGFQTNGLLLDDEWCLFFVEEDFLIGLSVDGPGEFHDHYRTDHKQDGSLDKVLAAVELLKKHGVNYNTLTVVHSGNVDHAKEIYDFLKSIGSTFWQFIPVVERFATDGNLAEPDDKSPYPLTPWSVEPDKYGHFLELLFQRWVRQDVGTIFIQHFESALANQMGLNPGVCVWNETCGKSLAIEHNGDLYPCDHYVFPKYKLGNLLETPLKDLVHSEEQQQFGRDKLVGLPQICRECEVLDLCHGECPKHRFVVGEVGETGLNVLCTSYKHFFSTIRPELGVLAELIELGRPVEAIMEWMTEKDAGFPNLSVSDDEECPCGSSRPYIHCCKEKKSTD